MKQLFTLIAILAATGGCSTSNTELAVKLPTATTGAAVAATLPTIALEKKPGSVQPTPSKNDLPKESKTSSENAENQTLDIGDLFAAPKAAPIVFKEPERKPEPESVVAELPKPEQAPPPVLRLIGFSEMDELKALLSINGKLNIIALRETVEGVELVAMEPPLVTLKHGETEIKINLMEQPWFHVAGAANANGPGANHSLPKPLPVAHPGVGKMPPAPPAAHLPNSPSKRPGADHRFPAAAAPPPVPRIGVKNSANPKVPSAKFSPSK